MDLNMNSKLHVYLYNALGCLLQLYALSPIAAVLMGIGLNLTGLYRWAFLVESDPAWVEIVNIDPSGYGQ